MNSRTKTRRVTPAKAAPSRRSSPADFDEGLVEALALRVAQILREDISLVLDQGQLKEALGNVVPALVEEAFKAAVRKDLQPLVDGVVAAAYSRCFPVAPSTTPD